MREIARINNVDKGIKEIKDAVGMKKVIIVLNDVDDIYQFDKLVGKCKWFGAGSRIIVTSRNMGLLDTIEATYQIENLHEVYGSYEPHLMESIHSLELFSRYAFMRDTPPEDYGSLAQKAVSSSRGLPLLRDLGRENVREENMAKPGMHSRLWCSEEASKLWEGRMDMDRPGETDTTENNTTYDLHRHGWCVEDFMENSSERVDYPNGKGLPLNPGTVSSLTSCDYSINLSPHS
ncbi:hypothetical protein LguiA_012739 [Lonicera macranthoides]